MKYKDEWLHLAHGERIEFDYKGLPVIIHGEANVNIEKGVCWFPPDFSMSIDEFVALRSSKIVQSEEPKPFIQSCEHGKLSGQRCRECNRNVPYGSAPAP